MHDVGKVVVGWVTVTGDGQCCECGRGIECWNGTGWGIFNQFGSEMGNILKHEWNGMLWNQLTSRGFVGRGEKQ
jgi:hypothetical protein